MELSRVHLFDIATQYRAIFTDEDPLVLASQNANTNESAIFHTWIVGKVIAFFLLKFVSITYFYCFYYQVTDFLCTLEADLPKIAASSLESVFSQCMYFGLSFGRIGADFRVLLVPVFSQVVWHRFDRSDCLFHLIIYLFILKVLSLPNFNVQYPRKVHEKCVASY